MKMTNIRIQSQGRKVYNGRKYVELYDVIADSERFGKDEIMYQGDFQGCVDYLSREGYDYKTERFNVRERRRGDIQMANKMFRVMGQEGSVLELLSRDYFTYYIDLADLTPIAPDTFRMAQTSKRRVAGRHKDKTVTVKINGATTW